MGLEVGGAPHVEGRVAVHGHDSPPRAHSLDDGRRPAPPDGRARHGLRVPAASPRLDASWLDREVSLGRVWRRDSPRLHDEIREGEMLVSARECRIELVPPSVLDPFADGRAAQGGGARAEVLERRDPRVDAGDLDREPMLLQEVRHRVFEERPSGTPTRFPQVVAVMATENEGPTGPEGAGRVRNDLRGHAEVADDHVDRITGELVVRRLLDVAPYELGPADISNPRVGAGMSEPISVQVHADHSRAETSGFESESALPRSEVEHEFPAQIFAAELVKEHRTQGVDFRGRLSPREGAAQADDIRHTVLAASSGGRDKSPPVQPGKAHMLIPRGSIAGSDRRWTCRPTGSSSEGGRSRRLLNR